MKDKLLAVRGISAWFAKITWLLIIAILVGVSIAQFYLYQPLVPKASAISPQLSNEYVLWVNDANNAYQSNMLHYAEGHAFAETRFAADYRGQRQYTRYFGYEAASRRSINYPLPYHDMPIEGSRPVLFLLHWPGPAGGLSEQVEYRSTAELTRLRETTGWGLVYDNGESFILKVR